MNVIKLIRRSTEKTLQDAIDFNSLYSACSKAINETLKTFPKSVTENLNESELLALYVMSNETKSESFRSSKTNANTASIGTSISIPSDDEQKKFIELVRHKYILDDLDLDFASCAIFICGTIWRYRRLTVEESDIIDEVLLNDIVFYMRTVTHLPNFMCNDKKSACKELCVWCIKNDVNVSDYSLHDLLRLYVNDLLSKDIVNWCKPDTDFVYTVVAREEYYPKYILEFGNNDTAHVKLENIKRDRYSDLKIGPKLDYELPNIKLPIKYISYSTLYLFSILVGDEVAVDILKHNFNIYTVVAFTYYYVSSTNFDDQYKIDQTKKRI